MGSAHSVTDAGIVSKYSGVIPRVIKDLFDGIKERAEKCEFVVKVWYAEVHNYFLVSLCGEDIFLQKRAIEIFINISQSQM